MGASPPSMPPAPAIRPPTASWPFCFTAFMYTSHASRCRPVLTRNPGGLVRRGDWASICLNNPSATTRSESIWARVVCQISCHSQSTQLAPKSTQSTLAIERQNRCMLRKTTSVTIWYNGLCTGSMPRRMEYQ
jgi:hypothetical protein